jgi:hypothetical protein
MGGPLVTCAVAARMLSELWGVPIVGVNHCVGEPGGRGGLGGGVVKAVWKTQGVQHRVLRPDAA